MSKRSLAVAAAALGFQTRWIDMPMAMKRAGHRVASHAGPGRTAVLNPSLRGAGDVQFVAPCTVGIDGLGAQGRGAHTDDEDLEVASIERGAIPAALLIYRLTRPAPQ